MKSRDVSFPMQYPSLNQRVNFFFPAEPQLDMLACKFWP